jgi:FYVE/RhoGEF/PH domain-containing protein 5/6
MFPNQDMLLDFTNLQDIFNLSKGLHKEFECRLKTWKYSQKISDIFVKECKNLAMNMAYLKNFSDMIRQFDEACKKFPQFGKQVTMFEKLPKYRNLKFQHFRLKPVQRLPQYKLLLEDYLKHLEKDNDDFIDTRDALRIVSYVLKHANDAI